MSLPILFDVKTKPVISMCSVYIAGSGEDRCAQYYKDIMAKFFQTLTYKTYVYITIHTSTKTSTSIPGLYPILTVTSVGHHRNHNSHSIITIQFSHNDKSQTGNTNYHQIGITRTNISIYEILSLL